MGVDHAMLLLTDEVFKLCAAPCGEAAFELVFDLEALQLIDESVSRRVVSVYEHQYKLMRSVKRILSD
jgi:hypothetical protein